MRFMWLALPRSLTAWGSHFNGDLPARLTDDANLPAPNGGSRSPTSSRCTAPEIFGAPFNNFPARDLGLKPLTGPAAVSPSDGRRTSRWAPDKSSARAAIIKDMLFSPR